MNLEGASGGAARLMAVVLAGLRRLFSRLPLHLVNGLSVSLGIALVQVVVASIGGHAAALMALTGAICASLPDQPVVPRRALRRVLMAGLAGTVSTMLVVALRPYPLLLGLLVLLITFVFTLALAWGPRAGPLSFVGMLALVFAMAAPAEPGWEPVLRHGGWALVGALLYAGWVRFASYRLQRAYRRLALAAVIYTLAQLLRARADVLRAERPGVGPGQVDLGLAALRDWLRHEAVLNDRLQAARDLLYEEPVASGKLARQTALLVQAIDLRDTLLAGELDLNLLGRDRGGRHLQALLSAHLLALAEGLEALCTSLQLGRPPREVAMPDASLLAEPEVAAPGSATGAQAPGFDEPVDTAAALARDRLRPGLAERARRMQEDLARMQALWRGESPASLGLIERPRQEVALFLSGEDWSLAAVRAQWHWESPVLRHAVRSALALSTAFYLGLLLPWATHPHWLVLSVAVVLRGSLEQTLARRNQRITGTVIGCLLVLGLAGMGLVSLSNLVFLVAVGVAHAYANVRYLVTAIAATLMALLQAHLAYPAGGFAVSERLADTLLGALLAWAFCYLLPSWEHRLVPRAAVRLLRALAALSRQAMRWPDEDVASALVGRPATADATAGVAPPAAAAPAPSPVAAPVPAHEQRAALGLARREAQDAIAALAAMGQRSSVEPTALQLPLSAIVELLTQAQQMLSHLAAVRLMLTRRGGDLDREAAQLALDKASLAALALLEAAEREILTGQPQAALSTPREVQDLPAALTLQPWFERRLMPAVATSGRVAEAALRLGPAPGTGEPRR